MNYYTGALQLYDVVSSNTASKYKDIIDEVQSSFETTLKESQLPDTFNRHFSNLTKYFNPKYNPNEDVEVEYPHAVPLLAETYAPFVPADETAALPTCQVFVVPSAPLTTVQPLAAKVAPFSNPPSPVGLIRVV